MSGRPPGQQGEGWELRNNPTTNEDTGPGWATQRAAQQQQQEATAAQNNDEGEGANNNEGTNNNNDQQQQQQQEEEDVYASTLQNNTSLQDSDILPISTEPDPFNVDSYKMLHFPGANQCKGRNILNILNDRSLFGSRYTSKLFYIGKQKDDKESGSTRKMKKSIATIAQDNLKIGVDAVKEAREKAAKAEAEKKKNKAGGGEQHSYLNPKFFQKQGDGGVSTPPRDKTPPPQSQTCYSTPPRKSKPSSQSNNKLEQPGPKQQKIDGKTSPSQASISSPTLNTPNTTINNEYGPNKIIPNEILNVTSEIISYAEYTSATRFNANYLNHLNGGLEIPKRPRQMVRPFNDDDPLPDVTSPSSANRNNGRDGDDGVQGGGRAAAQRSFLNPNRQQQPQPQGAPDRSAVLLQQQINTIRRVIQQLERQLASAQRQSNNNNNNNNDSAAINAARRRAIQNQIEIERRNLRQFESNLRLQRAPPAGRGPQGAGAAGGANNPPNNNQAAQPTKAVSTISIAFSSDHRTIASTHGDHTIKISCTQTGKLIRTLDGHPRTPWTVKYHPTNSRIVASGCLGFQVRVWDWNYQKESVRKGRKMEKERKWIGRYDVTNTSTSNSRRRSSNNEWGVESMNSHRGRSPRGVVEGWKGGVDTDSNGDNCNKNPISEEEDDYASSILAATGIPHDDPAWYEAESEAFNYDDGIGVCLNMIRLNSAVISLSFHPSGEILAMASGSTLHLWDYNEEKRKRQKKALEDATSESSTTRESDARILDRSQNSDFPRTQTMDFRHESALRCVHFPPCGNIIIVGGVNPQSSNEGLPNNLPSNNRRGGMNGGGMSFHLRMWDFSLDAVLDPNPVNIGSRVPRGGRINDDGILSWNYEVIKEAMLNPRTIIPRVLLYNDGGFDLSQDGKVLSACADFWLPDGIDNAMDLIESRHQMDDDAEEEEPPNPVEFLTSNLTSTPVGTPVRPSQGGSYSSPTPQQRLADPSTPPQNTFSMLEPPSPPGKRNLPNVPRGQPVHCPHPLSIVAGDHPAHQGDGGRYVPHIVTVSLDTSPPPDGQSMLPLNPKIIRTESMRKYPNLGKLLNAAPLTGTKSSGVTCVKLSPSAEYCLLGYGVRENLPSVGGEEARHPVTSLYNVKKGMKHVCTLTCADDDVNIARFHQESGHGFVYGTKQGRVRVLAKRPWNYYHLEEGENEEE